MSPSLTQLDDDEDSSTLHSPSSITTATTSSIDSSEASGSSEPCQNEQTPRTSSSRTSEQTPALLNDDSEITWSREELRDTIDTAARLKVKGNAEFGHGQWELALGTYREALGELPPRRTQISQEKGKEREIEATEKFTDLEEKEASHSAEESLGSVHDGATSEEDEAEKEIANLRAVLSANVAACLLKLNRWKDAVIACDDALIDKPDYFKALHRRAMANESIGSWSSLTASLEDFNHLATLPDLTPLLSQQIKLAQSRIPKAIDIQQQKEKDEVLDKLKNLGNTVLGKFGFSLDNFKMQEQPGGGYSMSFQQ
ncbi:hypothetical protein JCM5350_000188 [Sporobolomyces pararoseus]